MGIRLVNVRKQFGRTVAVNDLTLAIEEGEFFVLLGPSGCGKTTTLRMIAGLERPTRGTILIDEREVTHLEPRRRDIAMVFQDYGLYPHMSVFDNIAFPLKIQGTGSSAERARRVTETAERLHIAHLLRRKPAQLSGGEKQRVALARSLVRNPRAFLMDEPLSNLDAKLRITMRSEIKRLVSELKITTVYVTHDQTEAMALATRVGIMDKGDMVQVGTPLEIYDRPATAFVAGFIGSPPMNMFKGELAPSGRLSTTPQFLSAAVAPGRLAEISRAYPAGRPLTVGVRPEHLELEPSGARNGASAKVELIEPLGADTYVYLSCDGIEMMAVARRIAVKVGERVGLRVLNEHIHLIDGETGRNLAEL